MKIVVAFLGLVAIANADVPRLDDRIVGGVDVDIRYFPYQVSVRIYDHHICGGSIVNANTILTAANCVYGKDQAQFSVRVGNSKHALGTSYDVDQIIQNRNYNPATMDYDMAIIKLSSSISFGITAQAVALQPQGVEVAPGTIAWVSGWGVTTENGSDKPASLRAVNMSVITNAQCNKAFGHGQISSHMMCAQTPGHDSCQGDVGGPLVAKSKLIGVVSWGYGCARPQYPGVYAKVSDMYSWIVSNSN